MSGGSEGCPGYGLQPLQLIHLFQKERKSFAASGTSNGKRRHGSTESDLANGSELVRKKRSREKDGLQKDSSDNIAGDEAILSKAMEDEIQQLHQRMDYFTHQVLGLLETGKAYFEDASTAFEEGVLLFHKEILETWEEEIEGLRNEDIGTRLREARIVLDKLQVSASTVRRLEALSNC